MKQQIESKAQNPKGILRSLSHCVKRWVSVNYLPFQLVCHNSESFLPRIKQSIRLALQEIQPGESADAPPRSSHLPHLMPVHARCIRSVLVPRTKTSN